MPKTLVLCDYNHFGAACVIDHIDALTACGRMDFVKAHMMGDLPSRLDLDDYDCILIHYSLVLADDHYLSKATKEKIAQFTGLKACFIQDEYRHINRTTQALYELGIDIVFTIFPEPYNDIVYNPKKLPNLKKVKVLTGYFPQRLLQLKNLPAFEERPLDISYKTRPSPFWLGRLCQEKDRIANYFITNAEKLNLKVDITNREAERVYGKKWLKLLSSSKATLGTETGANVLDFEGNIKNQIQTYLNLNPEARFEDVSSLFLQGHDDVQYLQEASPRIFEAIATKTLLILYEGHYSGFLKAGIHYVALKKDHSNIDEVIGILKNPNKAKNIIEQAYQDIALNETLSYKHHAQHVENILLENITLPFKRTPAQNSKKIQQQLRAHSFILNVKSFATRHLHKLFYAVLLKRLSPVNQNRLKQNIRKILKWN